MGASKLRLYHRLQVAARVMQKAADREIGAAAGLSTSQAAVLAVVAAGVDVTQRDVAKALKLNESAVTAMVSRLIKLGFLGRERSGKDARAWILRVRKAGETAMRSSRASFAAINTRIEATLSDAELKRLADCLERLTDAFDE
jgi:DNA-binding MarR family transcriptional regulator